MNAALPSQYNNSMSLSDPIDTFVICYTKPGNLWVAFSIKTRQFGVGAHPKEALANGISAADRAENPATQPCVPPISHSSHELMLTLAKLAHPITEGACAPGVVYKYERALSG